MSDPATQMSTGRRPPWAAFTIAAILVAVGLVLIWDASTLRQGGGYSGVGPAAVPRMVGGALIALGLWTVIAGLRGNVPKAEPQQAAPVLWILGGLVLQLFLLQAVGFVIATAVLFALTARGFGQRNIALALLVGLGLTLVVFGLFDQMLRLNLPEGPLERVVFGTLLPAVIAFFHGLLSWLPFCPATEAPSAGG